MARKFLTERPLTVAQQDLLFRSAWPGFAVEWECECATWRGALRPSPLSRTYQVRVDYRLGRLPAVRVISPELQKRNRESIPHVYPDGRLCLYMPKRKEWTPQMPIAETLLPWASLWLFHYENWHASGVWEGGGEHPDRGRGATRRVHRQASKTGHRRTK